MSLQSRLQSFISAVGADIKNINNRLNGITSVPTGVMLPFAGSVAPSGFLLCQGQTVSRSTYSALFAVIGTTHGAGDGSTTFRLPDPAGRMLAGGTPGVTGGSSTKVLTEANLPPHAHTINHDHGAGSTTSTGVHTHLAIETGSNEDGINNSAKRDANPNGAGGMSYNADGGHSHSVSVPAISNDTLSGNGHGFFSSTPFDITPPYLSENVIIKI